MKPLANERGSYTLEAALCTLGFATVVASGCFAFYLSFVNVWLNRQAYEAVVCLASTAERSFCDARLRQDAASVVAAGQLHDFHVERTSREARAQFNLKVGSQVIFRFHEARQLPLSTGG